jgi:diacylglycerol kinase family enzyme
LHVEPSLEIEGLGRAAFVFVANGSPYTYAKGIPVQIAPEADFELGLDVVAPVRLRRRTLPRTAYALVTGRARNRDVLYGHDLDRVVITCDSPMPLQADGEDLGDVDRVVFEAQRSAVAVLV